MKKLLIKLSALMALGTIALTSCNNNVKVADKPLKTIVLKIKQTDGYNGASVAYNPQKKLYYVAMAGNDAYPLEVFDDKGNNVYKGTTHFDVRGMWWNKQSGKLEGNGYSRHGVSAYTLNENGYPDTKPEILSQLTFQPDAQSAGAYDFNNHQIIYYYEGKLTKVSRKDFKEAGTLELSLPVSKDFINYTTVIYTGVKDKEIGLLDFENKKVYLFNGKTGKHTYTVNLPDDAVVNDMFRFSFANGHIWLYDVDMRSWTGYKLF